MLLSRSPLASPRRGVPFDLHVLGAPPAFILSQDRTLRPMGPLAGAVWAGSLRPAPIADRIPSYRACSQYEFSGRERNELGGLRPPYTRLIVQDHIAATMHLMAVILVTSGQGDLVPLPRSIRFSGYPPRALPGPWGPPHPCGKEI